MNQIIESKFPPRGPAPAPDGWSRYYERLRHDYEQLRREFEQYVIAHGKDGIEPHLRFADLKRLGICPDWDTLQDWVERRGFPVGIKVSRKWRIWPSSSIQRWLDTQAREE